MKKFVTIALITALSLLSTPVMADDFDRMQYEDDMLWCESDDPCCDCIGEGAQDGGTSALGASMLGWGLAIGAVIFLVAAIVPQSRQ